MKREELIESAARALAHYGFDRLPGDEEYIDRNWRLWEGQARSALTAILEGLREPSEEMLEAAERVDLSEIEGIGQEYPMAQMLNRSDIALLWQAMLSTLDDRSTGMGGEG